ncbi:hypothetical protein FACS189485_00760 [Spirochaetia bacterium]|nr:hypothetical protein FACS189485_00760 [Spirochaetia bacterium]
MAIIKSSLDVSKGIPQEVKARVEKMANKGNINPVDYDNLPLTEAELGGAAADREERYMDAIGLRPSEVSVLSPQQLEKIAQAAKERRERVMFSIRLSRTSINWWKSLGKGYTGLMTKFLEEAPNHPDWVKTVVEK